MTYNNRYCYFNREAKQGGCWDEKTHFTKNKILIRQIGEIPTAGIDIEGLPVLNSAFMITPNENFTLNISMLTLLGIINSKLTGFYWLNKFADKRKTFPKIKGTYLKLIPLPNLTDVNQIEIINCVLNSSCKCNFSYF